MDIVELSKLFTPKTIIVGDLNSKNILWGSPATDQKGLIIEKLIEDGDFTILNNGKPTYSRYNGTHSHLDLSLVCSSLGAKSYWEVLDDTLGSDHSPTVTRINVHLSQEIDDNEKFILSKADWKSFKDDPRKFLTAELISESMSVDENAEFITNSITRAAELSIPQSKNRKRKHHKPLPYWNENCKKAIHDRNKARNAMHRNKTLDNCITYRRLKGKAQHVIKSCAREYS